MKLDGAVVILGGIVAIAACAATVGARETGAAQQALSVWDGIYTEGQANRGEPLYASECASCHGPNLEGGETAPTLMGGEFTWNWTGLSVGDLFERLRVSMPQGTPGAVSRQQKADILAFVLSKNEFPAGETELANRTEFLAEIAFLAVKP